jgi:ATP-dependent RNA helicase DeaD
MNSFADFGLKPEILSALKEMGFETPTPIQAQILPMLHELPESLVALAQTGTGKTAGFGLPLLHHIDVSSKDTQALVLCPTRELCLQITADFKNMMKYLEGLYVTPVYGGAPIHVQARLLNKGSQVVVGTPGRVVDMIQRNLLNLDHLQLFVLDEADEMLNMGFKDDLETIFKQTPKARSTWLFSATMPPKVESIARKYMAEPVRISIGKRNEGASNVSHEYYMVQARDKFEALRRLLDFNDGMYGVIFCRTREETNTVAAKLNGFGYPAEAINGSLSQQQRDKVMGRFRKKQITLLVATDVAARGIDVDDLTHVVNYSLPEDPEVYVHRSGRTGRAGKSGICISIIHGREKGKIRDVERMTGKKFDLKKVPGIEEVGKAAVMLKVEELLHANLKGVSVGGVLTEAYMMLEDFSREEIIENLVKAAYAKATRGETDEKDINLSSSQSGRSDRNDRSKNKGRSDYGDDRSERRSQGRSDNKSFTRLDLNIGSKHNVNPGRLMGVINEVMNNSSINFGKIEIESKSSSIDVDSRYANDVAIALEGLNFGSREVNVILGDKPLGGVGRPGKPSRGKSKFSGGGRSKDSRGKGRPKGGPKGKSKGRRR